MKAKVQVTWGCCVADVKLALHRIDSKEVDSTDFISQLLGVARGKPAPEFDECKAEAPGWMQSKVGNRGGGFGALDDIFSGSSHRHEGLPLEIHYVGIDAKEGEDGEGWGLHAMGGDVFTCCPEHKPLLNKLLQVDELRKAGIEGRERGEAFKRAEERAERLPLRKDTMGSVSPVSGGSGG